MNAKANLIDLGGKLVFVTGGARGLGAAICEAAAAAGARVVVADLRQEAAAATASALRARGYDAAPLQCDVGDPHSVAGAFDWVRDQYGRLDALVNNAGVDVTLSIDELSVEQFDRVLRTNLHGPFMTAKYAAPLLRETRGHIVNVASTAAKRAWPNASPYHASKWGLMGLSYALHAELRPLGIKVTALVAGGMRTPFLLERFPDIDQDNLQDPAEVARAVLFALSTGAGSVVPEIAVMPMRETSWP